MQADGNRDGESVEVGRIHCEIFLMLVAKEKG